MVAYRFSPCSCNTGKCFGDSESPDIRSSVTDEGPLLNDDAESEMDDGSEVSNDDAESEMNCSESEMDGSESEMGCGGLIAGLTTKGTSSDCDCECGGELNAVVNRKY